MKDFNPNSAATADAGIFGLPYDAKDAKLIIIPVPWDVTTSYRKGTAKGPKAVLAASHQIDLFDDEVTKPYEVGIHLLKESKHVQEWNRKGNTIAAPIIKLGGDLPAKSKLHKNLKDVNELSEKLNTYVFEEADKWLSQDKIVGILGGDHSVPLGAFLAVAKKYGEFGILHFDAHSDTRDAFEGFQFSHASIMHNALESIPDIKKLTQVGIRDFCEEESEYLKSQSGRVSLFLDSGLQKKKFEGTPWDKTANAIVETLPKQVWVSFDIDGLDPKLCPNTGTPVPGGLEFREANHILGAVVKSGRKILGFDLNEVAPGKDEWDANVGARMLYKLCAWTLASQGFVKLRS